MGTPRKIGRGGRKIGVPRSEVERKNQSRTWHENHAKGKHLPCGVRRQNKELNKI